MNLRALFLAEGLHVIVVVCALCTMCTVLLLGHVVVQRRYALRHLRRRRPGGPHTSLDRARGARWPSVDVIVPCYNEDPELLQRCCESIHGQDYPGRLRVWLIDDGSRNVAELDHVYHRYERRHGWVVERHPQNLGKRTSQSVGFHRGKGELVATVDSDTVLDRDGIRSIVAAFRDSRVGAVTGDVQALNAGENWLTRVIDLRYRLLFERERAAQAWKGSVLCCSGPFSVYRRSALRKVWNDYVGQTLWGRRSTFGDDLHLTLLVLAKGYWSLYEPRARARTQVPTTLSTFARQQLRWNKSFYRELPRAWRALRGRGAYLKVDLAARLLAPLSLAVVLPWAATQVALGGPPVGQRSLLFVVAAILAQLAAVVMQTRNVPFLLRYGLVYLGVLLPIRVYALATLGDNRWGTREHTNRLQLGPATAAPSSVTTGG